MGEGQKAKGKKHSFRLLSFAFRLFMIFTGY